MKNVQRITRVVKGIAFLVINASMMLIGQSTGGSTQGPIDELRAPASPAFILLGNEPTSIERPSSARGVLLALNSSISGNDLIPQGFAMEVAPYWMSSHPRVTFDNYYHPDFIQGILQSASLSMATAPSSNATDSGTDIAAGIRCLLLPGTANSALTKARALLEEKQIELGRLDDDDSTYKQKEDSLKSELQKMGLVIQALDKSRAGFTMEFAIAAIWEVLGNEVSKARSVKLGVWLTPAYRFDGSGLNVLAVLRYLRNNRVAGDGNDLDLGVRLLWESSDVALSVEWLNRTIFDASFLTGEPGVTAGVINFKNTTRLVGSFDYRVNEDVTVSMSLGRDFKPMLGKGSDLISKLGLNWGLSELVELAR